MTHIYLVTLIDIRSNYEFLWFIKFALVYMELCLFTVVVDLFTIWSADVATFNGCMLFQLYMGCFSAPIFVPL
jgi:hypothetical protein